MLFYLPFQCRQLPSFQKSEIHSQKAYSHNFFILSAVLLLPARQICPENLIQDGSRNFRTQLPHVYFFEDVSWASVCWFN